MFSQYSFKIYLSAIYWSNCDIHNNPKIQLDEKYHVVNLKLMIDQGEDFYIVMCWLDANQYLNIQDY